MPEGDSLFKAAARLQPLVGEEAVRVSGSARAAREWASRLSGRIIEAVRSYGKHLIVDFEGGLSLRTHLGMTGEWHRYRTGDRWSRTPGKARVVIETKEWVGVCFAAPNVTAGVTTSILGELDHLGPDLLADEFDPTMVAERARSSSAESVAELLLDQRVMAGVGNVYKSEVLFLQRINPQTEPAELSHEELVGLAARARRLLWANRLRGTRNTTGYGRRADLWVYDRSRRPCRRCGTSIKSAEIGDLPRSTYWCPRCQPIS